MRTEKECMERLRAHLKQTNSNVSAFCNEMQAAGYVMNRPSIAEWLNGDKENEDRKTLSFRLWNRIEEYLDSL